MTIPIDGSDDDCYFEKNVEDEWSCCVSYLDWLQTYVVEKNVQFSRYEVMKRYWEDRLKALAVVVYKEKTGWKNNVSWLKILEAKYPSGIDWKSLLDEMS